MLSKKNTEEKKNKMQSFNYVSVRRCHDFGNGKIAFDADFGMKAEGSEDTKVFLSVYGCTWVEGENSKGSYKFVSMPQRKGSDGNYYNICRVQVSNELLDEIESQLEDLL